MEWAISAAAVRAEFGRLTDEPQQKRSATHGQRLSSDCRPTLGMARSIGDDEVHVGRETRCAHSDSTRDVIALLLGCCEESFVCQRCHEAATDHEPEP